MVTLIGRGDDNDSAPTLDVDDVLDLMANRHRRHLLNCLSDECEGGVTSVGEMVSCVNERIGGGSVLSRKKLEIKLHHIHLPRLAEAGVIEYDTRQKDIRCYSHPLVDELLRVLNEWPSDSP